MKKILIGVAAVVFVFGIYIWSTYNNLVGKVGSVDGAWAQVETQYQRRFDLIPSLVESVKGVLKQEQKVFGDISEARTRYSGAKTVEEKVGAANQVETALGRLLVIMENYPQLRSAEVVQTFMGQQEGTENRISVERKRYNEVVRDLNVYVQYFPSNIVANMFGFEGRSYFGSAEGADNAPKVDLSF